MSKDIMDFASMILTGKYERPFSYEAETRQFRIGKTIVPLAELEIFIFLPQDSSTEFHALLREAAVVISSSSYLTQMPRMTHWLNRMTARDREDTFFAVSLAMQGAIEQLSGTVYTGMQGVNLVDDPPQMQTEIMYGSSELVISPSATFFNTEDSWKTGFAGFEFHNADTGLQHKVLYAGVGALATLCIENAPPFNA